MSAIPKRASRRIRRVGARAAVHAAQFNGKQEASALRVTASLRCPRNGPADGVLTGATSAKSPLGALKQVPGKAVEDALQARIPANEVTAPCAPS